MHKNLTYKDFKRWLEKDFDGDLLKNGLLFLNIAEPYLGSLIERQLKKTYKQISFIPQESLDKKLFASWQQQSMFVANNQPLCIKKIKLDSFKTMIQSYLDRSFHKKIVCFVDEPALKHFHSLTVKNAKLVPLSSITVPKLRFKEVEEAITDMMVSYKIKKDQRLVQELTSLQVPLSLLDQEFSKVPFFKDSEDSGMAFNSLQDVLNLIPSLRVFEIEKELLDQNYIKAHKVLDKLLNQEEEPLIILAILAKHCRTFLQINKNTFKSDHSFGSLPPMVIKNYRMLGNKKSQNTYIKALAMCGTVDRSLKTSQLISSPLLLAQIIDTLSL